MAYWDNATILSIGDLDLVSIAAHPHDECVSVEYDEFGEFFDPPLIGVACTGLVIDFFFENSLKASTFVDLSEEAIKQLRASRNMEEYSDTHLLVFDHDPWHWAPPLAYDVLMTEKYFNLPGVTFLDLLITATAYRGVLANIEKDTLADIVLSMGSDDRFGKVLYNMGRQADNANRYFSTGLSLNDLMDIPDTII